jgi:hypothetical protein
MNNLDALHARAKALCLHGLLAHWQRRHRRRMASHPLLRRFCAEENGKVLPAGRQRLRDLLRMI